MKKGKIFVIDGTDGSGKATQTKRLIERLKSMGREVETIDFPRYSTNLLGGLIRECLDGKRGDFLGIDPRIVSVLYAGDRYESRSLIQGWLDQGKIVVIDRYVSSNQIHQGGKLTDEGARREFLEWLDKLEFGIFKLPRPDAIVYLHVPVETSMKLAAERARQKGGSPDTAETDVKHQRESQESALSIIKSSNSWFRIDCGDGQGGMLSPEAIGEAVFKVVEPLI
ncbi:thymidylate kinase [Candidatus Parcubacteria bacterium]|nr:thymidylate kinase [Candidatus Parcubacteria bacterium]